MAINSPGGLLDVRATPQGVPELDSEAAAPVSGSGTTGRRG
jgi:hypothetical protein